MSSETYIKFTCAICDQEKAETNPGWDQGDFYCEDCIDKNYEDRTGYCSFHCCMGGGCDGAC